MNSKGRLAAQTFKATARSRFAAARAENPELYRTRTTEYVVVTCDEDFRDGDRVLGGTDEAVMVERDLA